eukprot:4907787-Prymnesium_polylepis.1
MPLQRILRVAVGMLLMIASKVAAQCHDYCRICNSFGFCVSHHNNGICNDGGAGSANALCSLGLDCSDCGPGGRIAPPPPPPPPSPPPLPPYTSSAISAS